MDEKNNPQQILEGMAEKAHKRQSTSEYIIDVLPPLTALETRAIIGLTSIYRTVDHIRHISPSATVDIGFGVQSEPEIARDYLTVKYARRPAIKRVQLAEVEKNRTAPYFAIPCRFEEGCYIDLKSAYWQIIMAGGWDIDYYPFHWLSPRSDNSDFPAPHLKVARNSIVSLARKSKITIWTGKKLIQENTSQVFRNAPLWAFVMDTLHSVACDMIEIGAVYVHTDGYIVPADQAGSAFRVLESWGLLGGIKAWGETEVKAVGVYQVGSKRSLHKTPILPHSFDNVATHYRDWLKPRFNWLLKFRVAERLRKT